MALLPVSVSLSIVKEESLWSVNESDELNFEGFITLSIEIYSLDTQNDWCW